MTDKDTDTVINLLSHKFCFDGFSLFINVIVIFEKDSVC